MMRCAMKYCWVVVLSLVCVSYTYIPTARAYNLDDATNIDGSDYNNNDDMMVYDAAWQTQRLEPSPTRKMHSLARSLNGT
jgi:uncharacterized membrane protein